MSDDPNEIVTVFVENKTQLKGLTRDNNIVTGSNYGSPIVSLSPGVGCAIVCLEDGQRIRFDYKTCNDYCV